MSDKVRPVLKNKTDQQMRQLAMDVVDGKVFGSWNISESQSSLLPSVFMILVLMSQDEVPSNVDYIYEYLSEAGPRSINGLPCFFSAHMITSDDYDLMVKYATQLIEERKSFLSPIPNEHDTSTDN